jgi:hypothetical protein
MKDIKVIVILSVIVIASSQIVTAQETLGNSSPGIIGNSGGSSPGQNLLNEPNNYNTNTDNIYNSNGSRMNCYTNSYGQTICN